MPISYNRYTIPQGKRYALDGTDWTPAQIDTLTWFDANDLSTITYGAGTDVQQWDDKSGNGHHAYQGTATDQPTYNTTSKQLEFDGNDILAVGNVGAGTDPYQGLQNFAVIVLGSWGSDSENNNLFVSWSGAGIGNTSTGWNLRQRSGLCFTLRVVNDTGGGSPGFGTDFIGVGVRYSDNTINSRLNGNIVYTDTNGTAIDYSTLTNRSAIGGVFRADNWTTDDFHLTNGSTVKEVVVIDQATQDGVEKVEGYMAWKWGLQSSLPVAHPYKGGAPTR